MHARASNQTQDKLIMYKSSITIGVVMLIWFWGIASSSEGPKQVEIWVEKLIHKEQRQEQEQEQEKVTKLHFYFHRISEKSGVTVASTSVGPTVFGVTVVKDDRVTLGPSPWSTHIGYAQGMSAAASLEEVVIYECFTFSFVDPKYNGSTLAVLGINPIMHEYRETSIVGGTGVFRLARGVAIYQTYFYNATTFDSIIEVHLVISHY